MLRSQRALRRKRDHSTRNTRGCEPLSPRRGIYPRWRWKMAASQTTSLVPERSKSPPGSIFITDPVWMSDPISANRQITCLDPRMLTPPHSPSLIDLSPISLQQLYFEIWKQTLAGRTLPLSLLYSICFPLYITSPPPSLAITSRNHPSTQRGNNRSSLSLGRSDCCTFHYDRDMSDCLEDGSSAIWMNWC